MKLVQAREWADIYLSSPHMKGEGETVNLESILIDAYTAGWREGWEDGELCGYNRGREHNETDLEVVRNAGIQEGIECMQKAYQIRPRGKSVLAHLPEGYVLVPVEPTEKMLKAGEELEYFEGGFGSTCDEFYKTMIQAAQEKE